MQLFARDHHEDLLLRRLRSNLDVPAEQLTLLLDLVARALPVVSTLDPAQTEGAVQKAL
jgi:hypothetical protein